jgi:hypothetical protein
MKRLIQILLILSPLCFAVDHLYLLRLGGGVSNLIGSDAPKNSKLGVTFTGGAMGAQAFYDGGPMWGTELYLSQNNVSMDTTLWSDATGDYTRKQTFDQSFTRISLGLFLMKAWDFGFSISAGPQVSYLANCIRTIDDKDYSCVDDYRIYQLDAQMDVMVFAMEPFAIDVKYAQTVLPFDRDGKSKTMLGALTLGVSYLF